MKQFFADFRAFIARGNVIDLAVAVVVGVAFSAIITSLVENILMPIIGLLVGGVDYSELAVILRGAQLYGSVAEAEAAGAPVLRYGLFLNAVINFLIVAFAMFLVVRAVVRLQALRRLEAALEEAAPAPEVVLLQEIRDLLAAQARPQG
jgi:large conductance mechanosensitive channel